MGWIPRHFPLTSWVGGYIIHPTYTKKIPFQPCFHPPFSEQVTILHDQCLIFTSSEFHTNLQGSWNRTPTQTSCSFIHGKPEKHHTTLVFQNTFWVGVWTPKHLLRSLRAQNTSSQGMTGGFWKTRAIRWNPSKHHQTICIKFFPPKKKIHHMGVSKNNGTPKSSHFNRVFHYKPSILGYHYFWKHPYICIVWSPQIFVI